MTTVDEIKQALDEMDRLAAVHIAIQGDRSALIKDVREAETVRDRHETYVEREARAKWLRYLLTELDKLNAVVEAARGYVASPEAGHSYHVPTTQAYAALVDALAAFDAGEGA